MTTPDAAPVVSVIIPVHTPPATFFREAIESVLAQTEARWELIIVLDAASKDCIGVAHEMVARDARVRVIGDDVSQPRGANAARYFGGRHASAPYLAFLDADDVFEPRHLEHRIALLDAHPEAAMVYGSSLYWYSWAGDRPTARRDFIPALGVRPGMVYAPPTLILAFVSGTAAVPCPCSVVIRRSAYDAVGESVGIVWPIYEDQLLYARVGLRMSVVADGEVLDRYRQHPASVTAQATRSQEVDARLWYLDWLEQEVVAARGQDPLFRRAIASERWKLRHPALARVVRLARRVMARVLFPARARKARRPGVGTTEFPSA